jgi:hypothetical protein
MAVGKVTNGVYMNIYPLKGSYLFPSPNGSLRGISKVWKTNRSSLTFSIWKGDTTVHGRLILTGEK